MTDAKHDFEYRPRHFSRRHLTWKGLDVICNIVNSRDQWGSLMHISQKFDQMDQSRVTPTAASIDTRQLFAFLTARFLNLSSINSNPDHLMGRGRNLGCRSSTWRSIFVFAGPAEHLPACIEKESNSSSTNLDLKYRHVDIITYKQRQ